DRRLAVQDAVEGDDLPGGRERRLLSEQDPRREGPFADKRAPAGLQSVGGGGGLDVPQAADRQARRREVAIAVDRDRDLAQLRRRAVVGGGDRGGDLDPDRGRAVPRQRMRRQLT